MNLYPKLILEALSHVRYPGKGQDIVSLGMVQDNIRISFDSPTTVKHSLTTFPADSLARQRIPD